jgi:hypothetical protein
LAGSGFAFGMRFQKEPQKRKREEVPCLSAEFSLLRAGDFSFSLDVLNGDSGINFHNFFSKFVFFSTYNILQFVVIISLDPDPH